MSSFAIGDIHGNLDALDDLLTQIQPVAHTGDTVVFLGDYIDRGPASLGCVDRVLRFRAECPADVVTLMGNHEDWMLDARVNHHSHSWLLAMEVFPTIESYSPAAAAALRTAVKDVGSRALYKESVPLPYGLFFNAMPAVHLAFFEELQRFHETEDAVFAHAGIDIAVDRLEDQPDFALLMGLSDFVEGHRGPPVVVYGHRNNADLTSGWPRPRMKEWTIGLDTISHGVLTAVRLPDRKVFQSARHGRPS